MRGKVSGETACKACGARMLFVETVKGKRMPVDLEPVEFVPDLNGRNKYVLEDGNVVTGVPAEPGDQDKHRGYISHFATCPYGARFRRR